MGVELTPLQIEAAGNLRNGHILHGGVGSGKSRTSIMYFMTKVCKAKVRVNGKGEREDPKNPTDLYIITTAKKRNDLDWIEEALPFGLSNKPELSVGGIKVTVDSWNNIRKYVDVKDAFFIFDEQRLVGQGAWVKTFLKIAKVNKWVLLTATPGDDWMDYIPVFLANGFYKNRTAFLREHVVFSSWSKFPKVERYLGVSKLRKLQRSILVGLKIDRHTKRIHKWQKVGHNKELVLDTTKRRWNYMEERPIRQVSELWALLRRATNADRTRVDYIRKLLLGRHPRLIIFYSFDYELELLRELNDSFVVAEWNGHKHEPLPQGDSWVYLVQYAAGSEGWNCTSTDAMVFFSLTYSYKQFEQAQGRIDRLNTKYTDLYYYILSSDSPVDKAIEKSLREKEDFNERVYLKQFTLLEGEHA